jgi:glycerol-3-phosphate dehydrogenase
MSRRVVIAGDGQMGLVMAAAALEAGAGRVVVWGPFEDSVAALRATRTSPRLPGWAIPDDVEFTADPAVLAEADLAVNAIPTQFVRSVWTRLAPHAAIGTPIRENERYTSRSGEGASQLRTPRRTHRRLRASSILVNSGPRDPCNLL